MSKINKDNNKNLFLITKPKNTARSQRIYYGKPQDFQTEIDLLQLTEIDYL
jgi:hypothetical protein